MKKVIVANRDQFNINYNMSITMYDLYFKVEIVIISVVVFIQTLKHKFIHDTHLILITSLRLQTYNLQDELE